MQGVVLVTSHGILQEKRHANCLPRACTAEQRGWQRWDEGGYGGMRDFYGPLFAHNPDLHADIPQRIHVGSWVLDEEELTGMQAEGLPPDLHAAVVHQVVDGKIARVRLLV